MLVSDLFGGLDAVEAGQAYVHDDDVGAQFRRQPHRLLAVRGLTDDGQVGGLFEQLARPLADDLVILGQENSNGVHLSLLPIRWLGYKYST